MLQFGPLCYRIIGHGDWGSEIVAKLRHHLGETLDSAKPHLTLHALSQPWFLDIATEGCQGLLPSDLRLRIQGTVPSTGWSWVPDGMGGFLWRHAEHEAAFWTYMDAPWPNPPLFVLPWACLLQDIVAREGALVHAALVQNQGAGFLLAAPPGGGKTTASGRLPANWDLLADDAAFVWPDRAGGFLASPLPSWGYLTHGHPVPASLQRWRPAERIKLAGVCLLRKASLFQMSAVQPQEAVQEIYERFSEHPGVCEGRQTYAGQLFRAACSLARAVSAWQLELDMTCPYWENMESEILHYTY